MRLGDGSEAAGAGEVAAKVEREGEVGEGQVSGDQEGVCGKRGGEEGGEDDGGVGVCV